MNKTYRLVWNDLTQTWVAVAENVKGRSKRASSKAMLASALLAGLPAVAAAQAGAPAPNALPTGGSVVAGQAGIQQAGSTMTIHQSSDRAAIDWTSFDVGRQAQVDFVQPSAQSVTLNRVVGDNPSQIFGRITANGQVFLSNPGGVYFAPGASVDVGGLVATTHRIGVDDFMRGKIRFERQGATGSVINEGELKAALGGYIALLAPEVRNQGVILAHMGTAALAAGEAFELQFDSNQTLASLRVEASTIRALVDNRSAVLAPGGLVLLSAQAVDAVQGGIIRNSGRLEATGLSQRGGRIVLDASASIANSGAVIASATADGPAGDIGLRAPAIVNEGAIEARGSAAHPRGGVVDIAAGTFTQRASGHIDASAPTQGGTVAVQASGAVALAGRIDVAARAGADAPVRAPAIDTAGQLPQAHGSAVDAPAAATADLPPAVPAAPPATAADAATDTAGQGGTLHIQAARIELASALLDAAGAQGGRITLDASAPAPSAPPAPQPAPEPGKVALLGGTQLSTRGSRGQGGTLTLLGDDIALGGTTTLDASGATGGGDVHVGGGWQGSGGLHQATTVDMGADVRIDASATGLGDGGTVVLWSDVARADSLTQASGAIVARGGEHGGNGGRIETSGHAVTFDGIRVDAGAPQGNGGLWLVDPYHYTINQTAANSIAGSLNTGTSVTVTTTLSNPGHGGAATSTTDGNITLGSNVSIAKTAGGDATLTLQAHNGITFNSGSSVTSTAGKLNLVLWSRLAPGNAGPIRITGSTINTLGGHVWMGGGAAAATSWNGLAVGNGMATTWSAATAALQLSGGTTIDTGGGHFHAAGQGNYTGSTAAAWSVGVLVNNATIRTGAGNLALQGQVLGNHGTNDTGDVSSGLMIKNGSLLSTTSGAITLQGSAAASNTPAGAVFGTNLADKVTIQSGSGAISIYGTNSTNTYRGSGIWLGSGYGTSGNGNQSSGAGNGYNVAVVSDSGNVLLDGRAASTRTDGWTHAFAVITYGSDRQLIKTASGNITIKGDANVLRNDASGVQFQAATNAAIHVVSSSGDIYVQGFQTSGSTHHYNNALRFTAEGSIRFGALTDDASSYSGRITFEADSIWSRGPTAGGIKAYGSGDIAFQSSGSSSVKDFRLVGTDIDGNVVQASLWDFGNAHSSFTIGKPTENKTITLGSPITAAGPITVYGGTIQLNNNLTTTQAGAAIRLLAAGSITSTSSVGTTLTLNTNAGDVILASASRGASSGNIDFEGQALAIDTRPGTVGNKDSSGNGGGAITLGGGNALGTGYATGVRNDSAEGIRARDLTLRSGGGAVNLRGRSWAGAVADAFGAWGIGVYRGAAAGNLTIDSGAGRIRLEGIGRSTGAQSYKQGIAVYGATDIRSAHAGDDAIQLIGTVTATAGNYRNALDFTGTTTIAATGNGGGVSIHGNTTYSSLVLRGDSYLLANGGDLKLSGTQLAGGQRNEFYIENGRSLWLGSASGSAVTQSRSNLLLEYDHLSWQQNAAPKIATTGTVTIQSNTASFRNQAINTSWFNWNQNGQTIGGLTIGRPTNIDQNVTLDGTNFSTSPLVVNGAVTVYGKVVEVTAPLTITGNGDILLRAYADGNTSLLTHSQISKTGGDDATLILHANGRVQIFNNVIATGAQTGKLNIVLWADGDGNRQGGASVFRHTLTTNGGHVWIGGGAGSTLWNGLTVGDGAAPGAYGSNHNGVDLNGTFNTGGGDFYVAGKSYVANGSDISPTTTGDAATINAAGGNVTFVGNRIFFGAAANNARTTVNTTGTLTIRSYDDSFGEDFNVRGSLSGNHWVGSGTGTGTANLTIQNAAGLGGLVIGKDTNTRAITVHNSLAILGDISLFGGRIANSGGASLTSTAGSILLDADRGRGLDFNGRGISWIDGGLTASSTAEGSGNLTLLGRGGSKPGDNQGVFLGSTTLSAGGDVRVVGISPAQNNTGVFVNTGVAMTAGRTLTLDGRNEAMVSGTNRGLLVSSNATLTSARAMTLTGRSGIGSDRAVELENGTSLRTTGSIGHIRVTALNGGSIGSVGGGNGTSATITAAGGADITLSADRLAIDASRPLTLATTGTLTLEPNSHSFPTAFVWDGSVLSGNFTGFAGSSLAHITIANVGTLGGLTLGKPTNLSDIRVATDAAMQAAGPIRLFGQNLALAGRITAQGNGDEDDDRIELHARGTVTQGGEALTAHALSLQGGGRFTLTAPNNVDELATGAIGRLDFLNNGALTIGSIVNRDGSTASGITASGKVLVETLSGDLRLHADASTGSTATDALVLNAGRAKSVTDPDFHTGAGGSIVAAGGVYVTTGTGGRATLYSGSIAGSTGLADLVGSGSGRFRYASDETTTAYLSPLGTGLYAIYREQPTLSLQGVSQTTVYGNDAALHVQAGGLQNGDSVSQSIGRLPTVTLMDGASAATRNAAGHLDVRRDGGGQVVGYGMALSRDAVSALGYALAYDDSATVTVTPRALSAVINDDAKFVGLADIAGYAGATFSGFARGETAADVGISATIARSIPGETIGAYADALTGTIAVTSGNYVLDPARVTAGTYHIVDPSTLIVSVGSASAVYGDAANYDVARVRYYDAASHAEVSLVQGANVFDWHLAGNPGQAVQFTLGSAGIDVGLHAITGTVVTPHALPGTASSSTPNQLLAIGGRLAITPRTVTLAGSKVYDGSDVLGAGALALGNLAYGETLGYLGGRANDRNVATADKYVSELTLTDGTGLAGNYQLPSLAAFDGANNAVQITPRELGVAVDKVYDGLATASASQTTLTNLAAGEALSILGVQLSDAHVATSGKYVDGITLGDVTDGTSGVVYRTSNYALPGQSDGIVAGAANPLQASAGNTVTITPRTLTVRIDSATGTVKTYDGDTDAQAGFTALLDVDGYVAGDDGTLDYDAAYDTKNVDAALIQLNGLTLAGLATTVGSQASDYQIDGGSAFVAGSIAARTVHASANGTPTKVYDGTTSANGALVALAASTASTGRVGDEDLRIVAAGGSFSDANAGTGRTYSLLDITLAGDDARNYVLSSGTISGSDGVITPRALTLEAVKVYDGSSALASVTVGNLVQGEYLQASGATAASARVGGPDGDTATLDNFISAITLSNVMDGSTTIYRTSNYSLPGRTTAVVSGAANSLSAATGNHVTITPALLTVQLDAMQAGKVYDGTVEGADQRPGYLVSGLVAGDTAATLTQAGSTFNSANVADAHTFTVSGIAVSALTGSIGSAASDYVLDTTSLSLPGTITARAVAVDTGEVSKVYDATTGFDNLTVGLTTVDGNAQSGLVAADAGSVVLQASGGGFDSKHAGNGKSYTLTGLTLAGSAAGNYEIASGDSISGLNGVIDRKQIQVQNIAEIDKVYDGTLAADTTQAAGAATLAWEAAGGDTARDGKVYTGDDIALSHAALSGTFNSKDVASADTVTLSGFGLSGADAGNYVLAPVVVGGSISRATISAVTGITAADKVYDGSTGATLGTAAAGFTGMVAGDTLAVDTASGVFRSPNANTGIIVDISGVTLGGSDAGNYTLASTTASTTATITQREVTVSQATAGDKVYDGTTAATVTAGTLSNLVSGESLTVSASGAFADQNAADGIAVNTTTTLADGATGLASNYQLVNATGATTADITRREVTVTQATAGDKAYDGTTTATVTAGTLSNLVSGEALAVSATGTFADKNAADGIAVDTTTTLADGATGLAGNYQLVNATGATTADITRREVTVTQATADSKVYDGTTAAAVTAGTLSNLVAGEALAVSASGVFTDKNAADGITVDTTTTLADGATGIAGNYQLVNATGTTTADITRRDVTVTQATADSKVYDGTTAAAVTAGTLSNLVAGEALAVSASGVFTDKNAADGITVHTATTLADGATGIAGNYRLVNAAGATTADITRRDVTITQASASDKTYDGTTAATVTAGTLSNLVAGEALAVSATGTFADKNAADGIAVNTTTTLADGATGIAGNYRLVNATGATTADITRRDVTVTQATADNKVYDGTTAATVTAGTLSNLVAGEALAVSATGAFTDKNATDGIAVDTTTTLANGVTGLAGNYRLVNATGTTTADITRREVTVTQATAGDKAYDGTTAATVTAGTLSNLVAGEALSVSATGAFIDRNAADGIAVDTTTTLADGATGLAGNYRLVNAAGTTTADITRRDVTVTQATADNKAYDGTTAATVAAGTLSNLVAGETLAVSASGAFADKNAADGIAVETTTTLADSATGLAGNYRLVNATGTTTADITRRDVTVTQATADNKVYDGTTAATVTAGTLSNLVAGESLTLSTSGAFADQNAADGIAVDTTTTLANGATGLAGNYRLVNATGTTTADITRRDVTVTQATADNKVYDGTTAATVAAGTLSNLVAGESLALAASGTFADQNAADGITVHTTTTLANGATGLAGNYRLVNATGTTTADITRRDVTVTQASASDKAYDGTTAATITAGTLSNLVSGETLTVSASGAFADRNAADGIAVHTTTTLADGATGTASNYQLVNATGTTTADITRREVTVAQATADNKVYDGTNAANVTAGTLSNLVAGETLAVSATGTFADKNAADGIAVHTTTTLADGATGLASNYQLVNATGTTAADIARRDVTVTQASASDKAYDGTTVATVAAGTLSNLVAGETLAVSATGAFTDKNAADGIAVHTTTSLADGATGIAGNYRLVNATGTTTADITRREVTVTQATADDKVYDGTTAATVTAGTLGNLVVGESLALSASGTFADQNAADGIAVHTTTTLADGATGIASNYRLVNVTGATTADITRREVTVTQATADNKVYDGTTAATVTAGTLSNLVAGESLALAASGTFADKNAADGITVHTTTTLADGATGIASNYQLVNATGATTADITRRDVTVTQATADNKVYDGTTNATVTAGTLNNLVAGESLALAASGTFADKNAADGITVHTTTTLADSATGIAGNYRLVNATGSTSADIARREVSVTQASASDKTYDGTTAATVTAGTLSNLVSGETLTVSASGAFADKNAADGIAVHTATTLADGANGLAGNYQLVNATGATTAGITRREVTVTQATAGDKVYDGTTAATVTAGTLSNLVAGEALAVSASGVFTDKNAADGITVDTTTTLADGATGIAGNYQLINATGTTTADIARREVTVTQATASDRAYDGTTAATVTAGTLSNLVSGESLTVSASGAFADRNAANGIAVDTTTTLADGATGLASNYQLVNATGTTTADIARREVTVTQATADSKVYDGTTAAAVTAGTLSNLVAGEALAVSAAGTFADKNAADGITVHTATTLADGATGLAGNYRLVNTTGTTTADITRRDVTVTQATADNKVYDGTTAATVTAGTLSNLVAGETLAVSAAGTFADKNAADGITVHTATTLADGATGLAGNYRLVNAAGTTIADIERRTVTVTGLAAADKTYDGSSTAIVADLGHVDTGVGNETLALAATHAAFADANAGSGKTVTVTGYTLLDGAQGGQAGNYRLSSTSATATADIARAELTVIANDDARFVVQADSASYNGVSYSGFVAGETSAVLHGQATVVRTNASQNQAGIYLDALTADVSGLAAANYRFVARNGSYTIVPSNQLLVRMAPASSTYGTQAGYTLASAEYEYQGVIYALSGTLDGNNRFTVQDGAGGSASFTVAPKEAAHSSAGALRTGSYQLGIAESQTVNAHNFSDTLTLVGHQTVTPKAVEVNAEAGIGKVYDGTTAMTDLILGFHGVQAGDRIGATGLGLFSSRQAGTGIAYTVGSLMLNGSDAGNYYLSGGDSFVGNNGAIAMRTLVVDYTGVDKVYDGTRAVTVTAGDNRISGDALQLDWHAAFADKNAGTGKVVDISDITLGGADAGNYTLASTTASTTASIAQRDVTVSQASAGDKVYDGTTQATVTAGTLDNLVQGETLTVSASGTFADKNAADGIAVETTTTLADGATGLAGNYRLLNATGATTADITRREVTVSQAVADDKVYDGTTAASLTAGTLSNLVAGETLTVSVAGAFDSKHAAQGATVGTTTTLADGATGLAGNYVLVNAAGTTTADIAQRTLVVDYAGVDKVYDGSTSATVTASDNRIGGDQLEVALTAHFADKNTGTDKRVQIHDVALAGADAGNYRVASTGEATAAITRRDTATWIGGADGNWFDPTNWADGAVPDLGNVAHVVIPDGVTVSFDTTGTVAPAETGPVRLDSLGNQGSLIQNDGTLTIGTGGVRLDNLVQNGGSLGSEGSIELGGFTQRGGSTDTGADFIVTRDFSQGGNGSVVAQGDIRITDTQGGTTIGNLQGGGQLVIASPDGDVAQAGGTAIRVGGGTTVDAGRHDVILANPGNDFGGPVNVVGHDVHIADGHGGLVLGDIAASGDLVATSTDGAITQAGGTAIEAGGSTTVDAGRHDVALANTGNDFGGPVNVVGHDVQVVDDHGGLVLGEVGASGNLSVASNDGSLSQTAGGHLHVGGNTWLDAPGHAVHLNPSGNDFGGPVTVGPSTYWSGAGTPVLTPPLPPAPLPQLENAPPVLGLVARHEALITVLVSRQAAGTGFRFALPSHLERAATPDAPLGVALEDGSALPGWLAFDRTQAVFVASSVPPGGLPLRVAVTLRGQRTIIVVAEPAQLAGM